MRISKRLFYTFFLTTTLVACSSDSDNTENAGAVVSGTTDTQTTDDQVPLDNVEDDVNEPAVQDDSADQATVDDGGEVTGTEGGTETGSNLKIQTADADRPETQVNDTNSELADSGQVTGDSVDDTNAEVADVGEEAGDSGDDTDAESPDSGEETQSDTSPNESTSNSGSVINATNYISLLRTGLTISRSDISPFDGLIDASEFTGNSSESVTNQPCLAAGIYDLTVTPDDDPGGEDQGFINLPGQTYDFTACSSTDDTTISGMYEFSTSLSGGSTFSDVESSEIINATITGVATQAGLKDITMNGTLRSFIFGSNLGTSFDLVSYVASDANGILEVTGNWFSARCRLHESDKFYMARWCRMLLI